MKSFMLVGACVVAVPCFAQTPYPPTKTVDVTDTYFGIAYKDPYRWLEDMKEAAVERWFHTQATLTDDLLARIPARDALADEWMRLDKLRPAKYEAIVFENGRVFYKKTLGSENVGKLYYRDGWEGAESLLFDPASFSPKGAKEGSVTTIQGLAASPDGRNVALGLSAAGAEFSEIKIVDVTRRTLLAESWYPSYGPIGWTMDSKALLYDMGKVLDIKDPGIELNRKTKLHKLGTPVTADVDFFSDEADPDLGITPREFPTAFIDESYPDYVVGSVGTVQQEMRLFYAPSSQIAKGKLEWRVLAKTSDNLVRGFAFHKDKVYAVTHAGAPQYKLVRTAIEHPDWSKAETVLPEAKDSIVSLVKSKSFLLVVYSDGITGRIVKHDLDHGRSSEVKLPASGSVYVSCPDFRSNRCIASITSWIQPTTLWSFDADRDTFARSIFDTGVTYPGFETLMTEEVEARGHDGVLVPLSIIRRRDMKLDGSSNAILQGYGAYGFSSTPSFNVGHSIALHDVVLGYCHPRGGGEKGEAWYKAGYKTTKPNTWKDFIACAEYLIQHGYTSPDKLAGTGTSAGGILISRAITERPDLFGAAICNVGCANAMRMEFDANGPVNVPEFGTVEDAVEARALYEMDGMQHVKPGVRYPAVLGVAGWNDPRVPAWQPGKFVAALQAASASGKPVLLKVNYDNGHFTEEKVVTFRNFASQFAFALWQTGHKGFQPTPMH